MNQKFILTTLAILYLSIGASAQSVNWVTDIAPILYENCASCHRDGGLGHFSLIGYNNAFANRFEIQEATESRQMPPWKADPTYRHYAKENLLSETEIQKIKTWVETDASAGDLNLAPQDPVFSNDSEVGMPDQVLLTPTYTVTATDDEYRCFVIPSGINQVSFLRGLEAIPGNHEVVHHVLVYEDTTGQAAILDAQTPNEPGYVNFGGPGVNGARLVGAWVPGARTFLVPENMGIKLNPGSDLIVQMHYPKGVTGMTDQTRLNLFFTPTNQGIREIRLAPILNHSPLALQNGPLAIPANTERTFIAKFKIPSAASVLSVAPHMHLIGRKMLCFAVTLQNDTIPLIRINDWDFNWQGPYFFQKIQKIPAQSTFYAYAEYDNTANNPYQPSNPPQDVALGEATTDEMLLVYFAFMAYQSGDENILLDSTLINSSVEARPENSLAVNLKIFPNPASEYVDVEFEMATPAIINMRIIDAQGRVAHQYAENQDIMEGAYRARVPVKQLPPGIYQVQIQDSSGKTTSNKFVKLEAGK